MIGEHFGETLIGSPLIGLPKLSKDYLPTKYLTLF